MGLSQLLINGLLVWSAQKLKLNMKVLFGSGPVFFELGLFSSCHLLFSHMVANATKATLFKINCNALPTIIQADQALGLKKKIASIRYKDDRMI